MDDDLTPAALPMAPSDLRAAFTHEHAIAHLDADLHWLDAVTQRLTVIDQGEFR